MLVVYILDQTNYGVYISGVCSKLYSILMSDLSRTLRVWRKFVYSGLRLLIPPSADRKLSAMSGNETKQKIYMLKDEGLLQNCIFHYTYDFVPVCVWVLNTNSSVNVDKMKEIQSFSHLFSHLWEIVSRVRVSILFC